MTWTSISTAVPGTVYTAARRNTEVKGNLEEIRGGGIAIASQAAGDIPYASSASQLARLAKGTAFQQLRMNAGATAPEWAFAQRFPVHGRLTLESGVAVSSSDQSAKTSLLFTPYEFDYLSAFNSSGDIIEGPFTELDTTLVGKTASKPYDVFVYDDGGTFVLEMLVWTNDTTRATAIVLNRGVWVKSGDITRRYLGTVYTDAAGGAVSDARAFRNVWNLYNAELRPIVITEATASWVYNSTTIRQARASTANKIEFVVGVAGRVLTATMKTAHTYNSAGQSAYCAFGYDQITAFEDGSDGPSFTITQYHASDVWDASHASWASVPGVGKHYLAWLERSNPAGTCTFYSNTTSKSGISGSWKC